MQTSLKRFVLAVFVFVLNYKMCKTKSNATNLQIIFLKSYL